MTKPSAFLLTRELAWGLAGALVCHAAWRCVAGLRILRYRANLRRQRRYVVAAEDIPWSGERLFLGRGFHWDQRHTQRLQEARLPEKQDLLCRRSFKTDQLCALNFDQGLKPPVIGIAREKVSVAP
jgi:hypothetical protein